MMIYFTNMYLPTDVTKSLIYFIHNKQQKPVFHHQSILLSLKREEGGRLDIQISNN